MNAAAWNDQGRRAGQTRPVAHRVIAAALLATATPAILSADPLFPTNPTIRSALCVGSSCEDSESFGPDEILVKSTAMSLRFNDTSTGSGLPADDWRITINDFFVGGRSYFSIQHVNSAAAIVEIEADAPSNSLFVDESGRIGLGTAMPIEDIHILNADTPTLRLEQNSASFGNQAFDVGGNEVGLFIRDATNGGSLPFRLLSGSESGTLAVTPGGRVGINTDDSIGSIDVRAILDVRGDGLFRGDDAQVLVQNTTAPSGPRTLFQLENSGNTKFEIVNVDGDGQAPGPLSWAFTNSGQDFRISRQGSGTVEFLVANNGNATLAGTLAQNSDRHAKQDIVPVDTREILDHVRSLPIATWSYKDAPGVRHLGPMAQDFHAEFGLGADDRSITSIDTGGVALAAIQALAKENARLAEDNASLRARNDSMEQRLERLEAKLGL